MNEHHKHSQSGFTLIEALIVTSLIGVLAGVAVPNLLSSRLVANEAAVIATMRAIATAQFQFQSSGELDSNYDAGYEYATLGELGALDVLRGSTETLPRNLLSKSVANTDNTGRVTHHGYHFRLFLPAADGAGVAGTPLNAAGIDAEQSQRYWSCVAWPIESGTTGNRAFFVNQQGQVLEVRESGYTGSTSVPEPGAGLVGVAATHINSQSLATDMVGADGNHWVMVH